VELVVNTGGPLATVARELGVKEQTLGRWVKLFRKRQQVGDGTLRESERGRVGATAQGELGARPLSSSVLPAHRYDDDGAGSGVQEGPGVGAQEKPEKRVAAVSAEDQQPCVARRLV
jgi:hypothetical protein